MQMSAHCSAVYAKLANLKHIPSKHSAFFVVPVKHKVMRENPHVTRVLLAVFKLNLGKQYAICASKENTKTRPKHLLVKIVLQAHINQTLDLSMRPTVKNVVLENIHPLFQVFVLSVMIITNLHQNLHHVPCVAVGTTGQKLYKHVHSVQIKLIK
jgi:hypothetical protein